MTKKPFTIISTPTSFAPPWPHLDWWVGFTCMFLGLLYSIFNMVLLSIICFFLQILFLFTMKSGKYLIECVENDEVVDFILWQPTPLTSWLPIGTNMIVSGPYFGKQLRDFEQDYKMKERI